MPGRISGLKEYPLKIVSKLGLSPFFVRVSIDSTASLEHAELEGLIEAFPKIEEVIKEYDKIITEMQEKYKGAFISVKEELKREEKCNGDVALKDRWDEHTTQIIIDSIVTGEMKRIFELKLDVNDSSVMLMHRDVIKRFYLDLRKIRDGTKEIKEGERLYEKLYDASCRLKSSFLFEIKKR